LVPEKLDVETDDLTILEAGTALRFMEPPE
jgi:hypothetical protein